MEITPWSANILCLIIFSVYEAKAQGERNKLYISYVTYIWELMWGWKTKLQCAAACKQNVYIIPAHYII